MATTAATLGIKPPTMGAREDIRLTQEAIAEIDGQVRALVAQRDALGRWLAELEGGNLMKTVDGSTVGLV